MKPYIGTKIIQAEPHEKDYGPPETHGQPGYRVVYPDGYTSWSPKAAFEEAYRETSAMSFGLAIEAMKKGQRVARAGWNGKGMWLYLVPAAHLASSLKYGFGEYLGEPTVVNSIAMKTADNKVVIGWLASQTDMLADDWQIVE